MYGLDKQSDQQGAYREQRLRKHSQTSKEREREGRKGPMALGEHCFIKHIRTSEVLDRGEAIHSLMGRYPALPSIH